MADLQDYIIDYSPSNGQTGVPLRTTIEITFSGLMATDSIGQAFGLEGPDTDGIIGPDSTADVWASTSGKLLGQETDFLTSPGMRGIVTGEFSFEEVDDNTVMTFTPSSPLVANVEYTANLTDMYTSSIGDTEANVGNTGNGELEFEGLWSGGADVLNVRISTAGVAGVAEFVWWKDSEGPVDFHGPILTTGRERAVILPNVFIKFGDGTFAEDDMFSAAVSSHTSIEGHVYFSFTTGSGAIEALPSSGSTSVLSALRQDTASSLTALSVVSTSPEDKETQVDRDTTEIEITFNKNIDPDSVDTSSFSVVTTPATDHPSASAVSNGDLAKKVSVSGNKVTITI